MRQSLSSVIGVIGVVQPCAGRKTMNGVRSVMLRPSNQKPQRPAALRSESVTTKENLKCAARCLLVLLECFCRLS